MRCVLIAIVLAAVSTAAFAQQYNDTDPRSNIYNNESLRRQDEIKRNEEAARAKQHADDMYGQKPSSPSGGSQYNAQTQADLKAAKARLLKMAPLPDARNPLLGRWRVEGAARSRKKDDMSTLMGMLNNPGGALCETLFGSGVTEFKPKTWSSIDSYGDDSLGPIHYRGEGKVVWAVPESKMFNFFGFEFASPDRMTLVGVERCTLVRAGAAAPSATTAPGNARSGAANSSAPPAAGATPKSSTAMQVAGTAGVVVDGAAFRCGDGSLLHVSQCQGNPDDATCKLTELHLPGLQMGKSMRRADIAARVKGCEAGGIRYAADDKPIFVR